jgi:phosphatidylinositol alpha-1,6-mannosyltransferase
LALKNKLGISDGDKILLTVGRLTKRKGQDLVINAISYIKDEYPIKYFIIGQGDNKIYLEELIKNKNLSNKVFIYDDVDDEELNYFYNLADIFVMPSIYNKVDVEGFGMVFLEAAANHLPIIAGQGAGITEVFLEDEILLVKNADLRELIRHIKELLNKPDFADKLANKAFIKYSNFNNSIKNSNKLRKFLD